MYGNNNINKYIYNYNIMKIYHISIFRIKVYKDKI